MKEYRARQKQADKVRLTIVVPASDVAFFNELARSYSEDLPPAPPTERRGRKPTVKQVRLAKIWSDKTGLPLPDYLETHHLSLCGWIGYARMVFREQNPDIPSEATVSDMFFDMTGVDE